MKIAIIKDTKNHGECLGFLCEMLKEHKVNVYFRVDRFKYRNYFKKIYDFEIKNINDFKHTNYDIVIKITSDDKLKLPSSKTIAILHLKERTYELNNFISLTPFIKDVNNMIYLPPLYSGLTSLNKNEKYENTILYIGKFMPSYLDKDTLNFLGKVNYNVKFIYGIGQKIESKHKNVEFCMNMETDKMMNLIKKSKFILGRKKPHQTDNRYTGAMTLAYSHNIPIILQECFRDVYKSPALSFKKDYSEIIDELNNMTDVKYQKIKNETTKYKEKIMKDNTTRFDKYMKNILSKK